MRFMVVRVPVVRFPVVRFLVVRFPVVRFPVDISFPFLLARESTLKHRLKVFPL